MILSLYSLLFKDCSSSMYVLYNTMTKNCLQFSKLDKLTPSDVEYLMETAHIFKHQGDDISFFKYFLNTAKYKNYILSLTLSMTYNCNFSCTYCYEQGLKLTGKITKKTNYPSCLSGCMFSHFKYNAQKVCRKNELMDKALKVIKNQLNDDSISLLLVSDIEEREKFLHSII